jgi:hypothetical protein
MSEPLDNPPYKAEVVTAGRLLTGDWTRWIQVFFARVFAAIQGVGTPVVLQTDLSAAVPSTVLLTVTQSAFYRLSWYMRIVVVDGVSSSAQLTVTWREGSHTSTKTFTALTGDTTSTYDGAVWPFYADSGTQVTFAIAYASNTPAKMRYRRALAIEQLS